MDVDCRLELRCLYGKANNVIHPLSLSFFLLPLERKTLSVCHSPRYKNKHFRRQIIHVSSPAMFTHIHTRAHVSSSPCNVAATLASPPSLASSSPNPSRIRCALSPQIQQQQPLNDSDTNRRRSLVSLTFLLFNFATVPKHASADGILDKYVKRKKLEPLEIYVPPLLLTQSQFKNLEKILEADQPQYSACRSLLRSGPASSFRVNIRAVAQYAFDDGDGKAATNDVDQCLRALEDLDALLLQASRNNPNAKVESMKAKIDIALGALDSLLQTVPSAVLDKGKAVVDAYNREEGEPENLDPEMKQLESIL